jgi:hypothetical protein
MKHFCGGAEKRSKRAVAKSWRTPGKQLQPGDFSGFETIKGSQQWP